MKLTEQLRAGCVYHEKRWSGDTHADLGGTIDEVKTNDLMHQAAAEIERLGDAPEALNDIADMLAMPTGSTTAQIVAATRERLTLPEPPAISPCQNGRDG